MSVGVRIGGRGDKVADGAYDGVGGAMVLVEVVIAVGLALNWTEIVGVHCIRVGLQAIKNRPNKAAITAEARRLFI